MSAKAFLTLLLLARTVGGKAQSHVHVTDSEQLNSDLGDKLRSILQAHSSEYADDAKNHWKEYVASMAQAAEDGTADSLADVDLDMLEVTSEEANTMRGMYDGISDFEAEVRLLQANNATNTTATEAQTTTAAMTTAETTTAMIDGVENATIDTATATTTTSEAPTPMPTEAPTPMPTPEAGVTKVVREVSQRVGAEIKVDSVKEFDQNAFKEQLLAAAAEVAGVSASEVTITIEKVSYAVKAKFSFSPAITKAMCEAALAVANNVSDVSQVNCTIISRRLSPDTMLKARQLEGAENFLTEITTDNVDDIAGIKESVANATNLLAALQETTGETVQLNMTEAPTESVTVVTAVRYLAPDDSAEPEPLTFSSEALNSISSAVGGTVEVTSVSAVIEERTVIVAPTCTCRDGTAATGTACSADGIEMCSACNDDFELKNGTCEVGELGAVTGDQSGCTFEFIGGGPCHPEGQDAEKDFRISDWTDGDRKVAEQECCDNVDCFGFHLDKLINAEKPEVDFVLLSVVGASGKSSKDDWERRECWEKKTKDGIPVQAPDFTKSAKKDDKDDEPSAAAPRSPQLFAAMAAWLLAART